MTEEFTEKIKFDEKGLVPAIVQEAGTGKVLMLAYMNAESLRLSRETGYTHFWSRSRQKLWKKGETSGHTQRIRNIFFDCDADTLLVTVDQTGPACHTGQKSCFFKGLEPPGEGEDIFRDPMGIFRELTAVIADRRERPVKGSYVNRLLEGGGEFIRAKVLEECREVLEASMEGDRKQVVYEAADLLFHLMILLFNEGLDMEDAAAELSGRFGRPPRKGEASDRGGA